MTLKKIVNVIKLHYEHRNKINHIIKKFQGYTNEARKQHQKL